MWNGSGIWSKKHRTKNQKSICKDKKRPYMKQVGTLMKDIGGSK